MKKSLFFLLLVTASFSACKKDSVTIDKKDIAGSWYYQIYNVQYFDANNQLLYNNNSSVDQIEVLPGYIFNADMSGSYGSSPYTYNIKKATNTKDSLIIIGPNYNHRFLILGINKDQMVLQENLKQADPLRNVSSGQVIYSTYRQWNITLGRTKFTR